MDNATDKGETVNENMSDDAAAEWLTTPEQSDEAEIEDAEIVSEDEGDNDDAPDEVEKNEGESNDDEDDDADPDDVDKDDDEEEADDDNDEEQPTDRYIVKVDGADVEVTLDELKRGYSGQAYIQRGMEQAKEHQKQLLQAAEAMQQERQQLLQMYQQAQSTGFKSAPKPPSQDMLQSDPIGYMQARADYENEVQEFQRQQQEVQFHGQQAQRQQQAVKQKQLQEQFAQLVEKAPEFGDAEKAPKVRKQIVTDAQAEYGFSAQDLETIADARVVLALRDAVAYRNLQKGKAKAKQPTPQAKAVTKTSAKRRDGGNKARSEKALQRAMKTQSDDDWVNVLLR